MFPSVFFLALLKCGQYELNSVFYLDVKRNYQFTCCDIEPAVLGRPLVAAIASSRSDYC